MSDNLENVIDLLNSDLEKKQILIAEKKEVMDLSNITNIILDKINKIDNDQDAIHDHFFSELVLGKDRSESSKVLVAESHKTKSENVKSLVEILKAAAKIKAAEMSPKNGVFIQTKNQDEIGISLQNLADST